MSKLVEFQGPTGPVLIHPDHVVAISHHAKARRKGAMIQIHTTGAEITVLIDGDDHEGDELRYVAEALGFQIVPHVDHPHYGQARVGRMQM